MRRLLAAAYAIYLAVVAYLVWSPSPSAVPDTTRPFEVALNVLMMVPFGLLGAFLFDRWSVRFWAATGLGATLLIEGVQLFLPTRMAEVSDVLANTTGAVVGLLLARLVRRA